jgi:AcrR family transcriptional regulator
MASRPTVNRRSTTAVRTALLEVAADLFAAKGYGGTSTKEIAQAAHTSETTIYRQFGSKAELFTAAVLGPLFDFLTEYEAWFAEAMTTEEWTDETITRKSVEQMYAHLQRHRNAVLALVSAHGDPESQDAARQAVRRLDEFFERLNRIGVERWHRGGGGFDARKLRLIHRFMLGLVFSVSALNPWFVPGGWDRPSEDELLDELTAFVLTGVMGEIPAREAAPPARVSGES